MIKNLPRFLFFIFLCGFTSAKAQSLQRQTMSSSGNYSLSDGTLIRQTIGQPYSTQTYYGNNISYRPGFQQPVFTIELIKSTITLKVFPNPTEKFINIETPVIIEHAVLSLMDNAGKSVFSQTIEHLKNYQLNCSDFANGLYIINITTSENKTFSAKLIINR